MKFKALTWLKSRSYIIRKAQVSPQFFQVLVLFQPVSVLEVNSIEYNVFKPKQSFKTGWCGVDLYYTDLVNWNYIS